MKLNLKVILTIVIFAVMLLSPVISWTATDTDTQTVTVVVPAPLAITASGGGTFTLTLPDYRITTESNIPTVTYALEGNNITYAPLDGFISAKISSLVDGVDIMIDPGVFTNNGGPTNLISADLPEAVTNFATLGTTDMFLINKVDCTVEADGKAVINGIIPISFKAKLTRDHEAINTAITLTITIKDA